MEKQFLLVVRNQRGFGKFALMAVASNYDTLNDPNVSALIDGGESIDIGLTEPNETPFKLLVSEV